MKNLLHFLLVTILTLSSATTIAQPNEIVGMVRFDANANGVFEQSDPPLPGYGVRNGPSGIISSADYYGNFYFDDYIMTAHTDTLSLAGVPLGGATVTPDQYIVSIPAGGSFFDSTFHFLVQLPVGTIDASGQFMLPWPYSSPGHDHNVGLLVTNTGNTVDDITVQFAGDAQQTWVGSNITPTSLIGVNAIWVFPAMMPMRDTVIVVVLHTDSLIPIGTHIEHSMSVSTPNDGFAINNVDTLGETVMASMDPNFKEMDPAMINDSEGMSGKEVDYAIHFQNTGTAPAMDIVVTDTLDQRIADGPITFVASSHICNWTKQGNVLRFTFTYIQLPDSGSDEPGSHGYVQFKAHTAAGLAPGTTIPNIANIFFDVNPPVITNTCWLSVALVAGIDEQALNNFSVYPNPSTGPITVSLDGSTPVSRIVLLDAVGHRVKDLAIRSGTSSIELESLAKGFYVLQAFDRSQRMVGMSKVIIE